MSTAMNTELTVAAWPGLSPRLLRTANHPESYVAYRDSGGYRPLADAGSLLEEISTAAVVGRGGAAFPMAVKLTTVRKASLQGRDTVLVANGEEGEPASVKDRWLLRQRPHLVLDGLRLAALIIGARHAHVYVSDKAAAESIRVALGEVGPDGLDGVTVSVCTVDAGYVAGEETAAVRAINGGPAKPTDKPRDLSKRAWAGCRPWSATSRRWRICRISSTTGLSVIGKSVPRARRGHSWPP